MMSVRETQPERTVLSWIRTILLGFVVTCGVLRVGLHHNPDIVVPLSIPLLLFVYAYFKSSKAALAAAFVYLVLGYWLAFLGGF